MHTKAQQYNVINNSLVFTFGSITNLFLNVILQCGPPKQHEQSSTIGDYPDRTLILLSMIRSYANAVLLLYINTFTTRIHGNTVVPFYMILYGVQS